MIWGRASRSLPREGGQRPRVLTRRGSCSFSPDRCVPPQSPRPGGAGMKAQSPAGTRLRALRGQDEPRRGLAGSCGAGCAPGTAAAPCSALTAHPGCPTPAPLELSRPTARSKEAALCCPAGCLVGPGMVQTDRGQTDRGAGTSPPAPAPGRAAGSQPCPMVRAPPGSPPYGAVGLCAAPAALGACGTEGALAEFSAVMLGPGSSGRALSVPFPPLAGARAKAAWPWVALAPGRVGAETCRAIKGLDTECCRAPPLLPSVQFI